jgi:FG-GAP-like repeat
MTPYHKIIATVLFVASLFTATINLSAANSNSSTSNKITSSQSTETKKILKKKLSLDYTNPKFETDLTKDQKDSILTTLKKWKGELPIDNTFTVTSIASLKTDTADTNSIVKKSKKETPNAQVVYMWARSTNPNWPIDRIPTGEESEEGDPRFIRTEFNILLKQTKNGKYKASIERDLEVKTESVEISESINDDKIYQDLFGTNIADNALTSTQDILVEPSDSNSSVSSPFNNISTAITSLSSITLSQVNSQSSTASQISSISSLSSNSPSANSSKTLGFLESILSFGTVKVSAGEFDYSLPWKSGDYWATTQSWHECYAYYTVSGCALDLQPYQGASSKVIAPISGTITRVCNDGVQSQLKIGNLSMLHLNATLDINQSTSGVYITKSSNIGNLYPYAIPENTVVNQCGTSSGIHLHLKMSSIGSNSGSFIFDSHTFYGNQNYSNKAFQSSNTPPATNTTQNVIFRDVNGGNNSIWKFSNTTHTGDTAFPNYVPPEWKIAGMGDFNADGYQDIFWRNSNNGQNVLWEMQNGVISKDWGAISTVGLDFSVAGIGDFNGDGYADILWRNTNGVNVIWNYNRNVKIGDYLVQNVPTDWQVVSVADFSGDGKADIFWRNNSGQNVIWNMNNSSIIQNGPDGVEFVDSYWFVAGVADFNGDGKKDIFWRNSVNGNNVIWNMNNRAKNASLPFTQVGNDFIVGGLGDFNQDGKADIFWRSITGGQNVIWNMNNAAVNASTAVGTTGASNTQVKGIFAK